MTYTTKDVANITGLSIFTIRFYDKVGLLPFVSRNKSGNRVFTESNINMMKTICCLKNTGMPIKDIKKYIDFCMEGVGTIDSRKKLLLEHRKEVMAQIHALNENLNLIDAKIANYDSPNAVEIITELIRKGNDEMRENCLLSRYNPN